MRNPDGTPFTLSIVHPKEPLGVVVVPWMKTRGALLLGVTEQWREALNKRTIEFPRGSAKGITEEEAVREFTEESAISRENIKSVYQMGTIYPDTGLLATTVGVFSLYLEAVVREHRFNNPNENDLVFSFENYHVVKREIKQSGCAMSIAALGFLEDTNIPKMY